MEQLERIWRRVLLAIGRGRTKLVTDDGNVQKVQVQLGAEELKDGIPRLSEYGFQSYPPADSDAIVLFIAGERTNGVIVACGSQQYRMRNLAAGEVAISDDKGQSVYLTKDGIVIDGGGKPMRVTNTPSVELDSPLTTCTGALHVNGSITSDENITATGNVADAGGAKTMAGMRGTFNSHQHGTSPGPAPTM